MKNKKRTFNIDKVTTTEVECQHKRCKDRPPGIYNLDAKFLSIVTKFIAVPVCHIINLSNEKCICPHEWKIAKVILLSKNSAAPFSGKNSCPISLLAALGKIMERIIFEQIQTYFDVNNLNTDYQHAYRPGYSTCTALTQVIVEWQTEQDNKKLVSAVLLNFRRLIYLLLLDKLEQYDFSLTALKWMESYLTNRKQTVFLIEACQRLQMLHVKYCRVAVWGHYCFQFL